MIYTDYGELVEGRLFSLLKDAQDETGNGKYLNDEIQTLLSKVGRMLSDATKPPKRMTIEEFDKKNPIIKAIIDLDDIIRDLNCDDGALVLSKGIGVVTRCTVACAPVYSTTNDTILIERFKQLLLERKQELINEFEKE